MGISVSGHVACTSTLECRLLTCRWSLVTGASYAHANRHVILPKKMLKLLPEDYFDPAEPGVLRILSVEEWRQLGITQSMGWEHYEVHAPEPHILLFRREKDFLEKVSCLTLAQRPSQRTAQ